MCGLAGWISLRGEPPDADLVRRMMARLAHRGPDGEGLVVRRSVAFGHRRLAILDLERGGQPMVSAAGASLLVHNGEIYNTPALRKRLSLGGPPLRTHSDTEVVLEGLEREGPGFLAELNGIFAFAWHHEPTGRTLLARDPFGVKPLYYHQTEERLLFASEIRALLADPTVRRELDPDELGVLLTLRYNPSPGTLLRGVRKVRPGHVLELQAGGRGARVEVRERRFAPIPAVAEARSFDDWVEAYGEALSRAVRGQLQSDVPVGIFLSGGIDSAAVAQVASAATPGLTAFTVGFEDPQSGPFPFDERDAARASAAFFGLSHVTASCTGDEFARSLPQVVTSMEEPVGSASAVPFAALAREAARSHKVVLSGQGADEPHGGYPRYQGALLWMRFGRRLPRALGACLAPLARGRRERGRRGLRLVGRRDPAEMILETYRHFTREQVRALLPSEGQTDLTLAARRLEYWREPVAHLDPVAQMMHVDARMWLADDLLLYADKLAMASGLEVRVPYLDLELMRLVESIPRDVRVGLRRPKRLHRAALERRLPRAIRERPKLGFDTPVDRWFRTHWEPKLPEWLWGSGSFLPSTLRVDALQMLVAEHRAGRADHSRRLYTLLALEHWGRSFL